MSAETVEPLIFTSRGNLPVADLKYEVFWHEYPETIKMVERYSLADEVVRESAHVYVKPSALAQLQQGQVS